MWAGSKHRDTREGKRELEEEEEKKEGGWGGGILGASGDSSVICKTYRLKGGG